MVGGVGIEGDQVVGRRGSPSTASVASASAALADVRRRHDEVARRILDGRRREVPPHSQRVTGPDVGHRHDGTQRGSAADGAGYSRPRVQTDELAEGGLVTSGHGRARVGPVLARRRVAGRCLPPRLCSRQTRLERSLRGGGAVEQRHERVVLHRRVEIGPETEAHRVRRRVRGRGAAQPAVAPT